MAVGKKTGGRQKGTPNKATTFLKEQMSSFLENYILGEDDKSFKRDFYSLEPNERLRVSLKMAQIVLPKDHSVDFSDDMKNMSLQEKMKVLSAQIVSDDEPDDDI